MVRRYASDYCVPLACAPTNEDTLAALGYAATNPTATNGDAFGTISCLPQYELVIANQTARAVCPTAGGEFALRGCQKVDCSAKHIMAGSFLQVLVHARTCLFDM